jgi:hypothetical protein
MITEETQFEIDWYKPLMINGMESNKGYYNLCLTIRDLTLYTKRGMKPHRHWRLKDIKQYFGLKGSAAAMLERLEAFKNNEL